MIQVVIRRTIYDSYNIELSTTDIPLTAEDVQQDIKMIPGKDGNPARSQALIFFPYDVDVRTTDLVILKGNVYPILQVDYITDFDHSGSHLEVLI